VKNITGKVIKVAKPIHQIPTEIKEIRAGKELSDIPYHSGIITMVRLK
jgi:hypothetical protein